MADDEEVTDSEDEDINDQVCPLSLPYLLISSFHHNQQHPDTDDVIYVDEKLPSKDFQDKAHQLQYPPHFYDYLVDADQSGASIHSSLHDVISDASFQQISHLRHHRQI